MSTENARITPDQAHKILQEVAALPILKLSLAEHSAVQQALAVLKPQAELTIIPPPATV